MVWGGGERGNAFQRLTRKPRGLEQVFFFRVLQLKLNQCLCMLRRIGKVPYSKYIMTVTDRIICVVLRPTMPSPGSLRNFSPCLPPNALQPDSEESGGGGDGQSGGKVHQSVRAIHR